jgi:exodeoxyribonuclease VII large subunit
LEKLLYTNNPLGYINILNERLITISGKLITLNSIYLNNKSSLLRESLGRLYAFNPSAILKRGYSITRTIPKAGVVKTAHTVSIGQNLEVMLSKGSLIVEVNHKNNKL